MIDAYRAHTPRENGARDYYSVPRARLSAYNGARQSPPASATNHPPVFVDGREAPVRGAARADSPMPYH